MIHLCTNLVMKYYNKGHRIGLVHTGSDVYFLKKGTIKIVSLYENGEELIKEVIKEGDIFGILGLLQGESNNDHAVAMEDSIVCIIDAETLKEMMEENRQLNNYIFKLAGLRIQKLERKLESLIYKNAESRIQEFIKDYIMKFGKPEHDFFVAKHLLSDGDIGKLTSTSRQTVNKILNRLKREEIIDFDRNHLRLSRNRPENSE